MGCCTGAGWRKLFVWVIGLTKLAFTGAIVAIIAIYLQAVDIDLDGATVDVNIAAQCLLGADFMSYSLCTYAYVVCGAGFLGVIGILCLTCCTCAGAGHIVNFVLCIVGTAWWGIAAVVFTSKGADANSAGLPEENWRNTAMVLSWFVALMFCVTTVLFMWDACKVCFPCCGGGGSGGKEDKIGGIKHKYRSYDKELKALPQLTPPKGMSTSV